MNLIFMLQHTIILLVLFCVCRNCSIENDKITKEASGFDSPCVAKIFCCKQIVSKFYYDAVYQMTHERYQIIGTYIGEEYFLKEGCRTCKCLLCVKFTTTYLFNSLGYKVII